VVRSESLGQHSGLAFLKTRIMKKKELQNQLNRIGAAFKYLREQKGFDTLTTFAIKYNLPPNQYWKIENGKANVTVKTMLKILSIHNKSLDQFFNLVKYC
jgi:hypothetical protein